MPGRMGQFVQRGAVIVDLFKEGGLRRHGHKIAAWHIIGFDAPDAEIDPAGYNQFLGDRHDLALGQRRGIGRQIGAQSLALGDVEDGEALERLFRNVYVMEGWTIGSSCDSRGLRHQLGNEHVESDRPRTA